MPTPAVYRPAPTIRSARFQTAPFGPAKPALSAAKSVADQAVATAKKTAAVVPLSTSTLSSRLKKT